MSNSEKPQEPKDLPSQESVESNAKKTNQKGLSQFCLYCGAQVPDHALFCGSCGQPLKWEREQTGLQNREPVMPDSEPPGWASPVVPDTDPPRWRQSEIFNYGFVLPVPPPKETKRNKFELLRLGILGSTAIVTTIVIGIVAYAFVTQTKSSDSLINILAILVAVMSIITAIVRYSYIRNKSNV